MQYSNNNEYEYVFDETEFENYKDYYFKNLNSKAAEGLQKILPSKSRHNIDICSFNRKRKYIPNANETFHECLLNLVSSTFDDEMAGINYNEKQISEVALDQFQGHQLQSEKQANKIIIKPKDVLTTSNSDIFENSIIWRNEQDLKKSKDQSKNISNDGSSNYKHKKSNEMSKEINEANISETESGKRRPECKLDSINPDNENSVLGHIFNIISSVIEEDDSILDDNIKSAGTFENQTENCKSLVKRKTDETKSGNGKSSRHNSDEKIIEVGELTYPLKVGDQKSEKVKSGFILTCKTDKLLIERTHRSGDNLYLPVDENEDFRGRTQINSAVNKATENEKFTDTNLHHSDIANIHFNRKRHYSEICSDNANSGNSNSSCCCCFEQTTHTRKEDENFHQNYDNYFAYVLERDLGINNVECSRLRCENIFTRKKLLEFNAKILDGFEKAHTTFIRNCRDVIQLRTTSEHITNKDLHTLCFHFTAQLVIFTVEFSSSIGPFILFQDEVKRLQIRESLLEIAVIYCAYWLSMRDSDIFYDLYDIHSSSKELFEMGPMGELIYLLNESAMSLGFLKLSQQELALLAGIVLMSPDRQGLKCEDKSRLKTIAETICASLKSALSLSHPGSATSLFEQTFRKMIDIRSFSEQNLQQFLQSKIS